MKITVNEIEYTIKSAQAIQILELVEKSGILDKLKNLSLSKVSDLSSVSDIAKILPVSYKLAHQILSIATASFDKKEKKWVPNTELIDDVEAVQLPFIAINIVKTLMFPITYAISDDPGMLEEKKSDSLKNEDTNPGKSERKEEPKVSSETSTIPSATEPSPTES